MKPLLKFYSRMEAIRLLEFFLRANIDDLKLLNFKDAGVSVEQLSEYYNVPQRFLQNWKEVYNNDLETAIRITALSKENKREFNLSMSAGEYSFIFLDETLLILKNRLNICFLGVR